MLAAIEPTDGVMYPGIVAFDHRRGGHLRTLGRLPALQVVAVDQGGCVDTVAFNRSAAGYGAAERRHYARLLDQLGGRWPAATWPRSARSAPAARSSTRPGCPAATSPPCAKICRAVGGLGLVACHSGTMVGILLEPARQPATGRGCRRRCSLAEDLPGRTHLYRTLAG